MKINQRVPNKGESIVNLKTLRSTFLKAVAAFTAVTSAVILGSCGGGGAASSNTGSILTILPSVGTFYAGVPYEFSIVGGVTPYTVSSSQPDIFPVPRELAGHSFTVIPNNPGVVDSGLAAGALQGRTVTIQVRDKNGALASTGQGIFVAQNFLTGYGVFYQNTCPAPVGGGTQAQACAGGEAILTIVAVTNGGLFSNRNFRLEVIKGPFGWLDCDPTATAPSTAVLSGVITCPTDHEGKANVRLRVQAGVTTQLGSFRIVDVASGVTTTQVLLISEAPPVGNLTLIPTDLTLTGPPGSARCGMGPVGALIAGGTPPYTAFSSNPVFAAGFIGDQVSVTGSGACEEGTIVIRDSTGRRGTLDVEAVANATGPTALAVSPATVDLLSQCGFSASVAYIGGAGPISALSNHPRVTAMASNGTVTITRALSDAAAVPPAPFLYPTSAKITLSDGTAFVTVDVTAVAATCP